MILVCVKFGEIWVQVWGRSWGVCCILKCLNASFPSLQDFDLAWTCLVRFNAEWYYRWIRAGLLVTVSTTVLYYGSVEARLESSCWPHGRSVHWVTFQNKDLLHPHVAVVPLHSAINSSGMSSLLTWTLCLSKYLPTHTPLTWFQEPCETLCLEFETLTEWVTAVRSFVKTRISQNSLTNTMVMFLFPPTKLLTILFLFEERSTSNLSALSGSTIRKCHVNSFAHIIQRLTIMRPGWFSFTIMR